MLTTRLTSETVAVNKPSPRSDVLFMHLRGVLTKGYRRINPRALNDDGSALYGRGLTVRAKFVCHTDTMEFPGLTGPQHSITVERTFKPVNADGTWNDAEISAYTECCNALLKQGTDFNEYSKTCDGNWTPHATQAGYERFQNFVERYRFSTAATQEPYWTKDEDGRTKFARPNPTDRSNPIANPSAPSADNSGWTNDALIPFDDDTPV